MPLVGLEPTISEDERPHTYALDRAATGTGNQELMYLEKQGLQNINSVIFSDDIYV